MSSATRLDAEGLILPRKLLDAVAQRPEAMREMNREIKWNARNGVSVLDKKSELDREWERRDRLRRQNERHSSKSEFELVLEKRLQRLEGDNESNNNDDEDNKK